MASLPIDSVLAELRSALGDSTRIVLQAPPGAGKTTRVPLALIDEPWVAGRKLVILEPRRLAARAAARRMAASLGEQVGDTVGFRVRGETRVTRKTRIEVVTEGVLTRMLISDPEIADVAAVVLDEFHERSLQADLALALTLQSQEILRPDLRIVVMSATLDGASVAGLLRAQTVTSEGREFPVEIRHVARRPEIRVEDAVARAIDGALARDAGSVLAFLPGTAEIHRTLDVLRGFSLPQDVKVIPLFGALSSGEQDAAITTPPPGVRKVVLATSIAESSITIDGVNVVVNCGLSRVPRFSPRTGMSHLATVRVSRASANQRAGRAGRTAAGVCYRLWDVSDDAQLLARSRPEILEADLATLALDLAAAGVVDPAELRWIDPPPVAALSQARALLVQLGALDIAHRITSHGRAVAALPVHPRLAHMLLLAREMGLGATACIVAALLGERDVLRRDGMYQDPDLRTRVAIAAGRDSSPNVDRDALRRVREEAGRLREGLKAGTGPSLRSGRQQGSPPVVLSGARDLHSHAVDESMTGRVLAWAYPDRVARRRDASGSAFLLRNGSGAVLSDGGSIARDEFLVIADLDGRAGHSRIYLAAPIDEAEVLTVFHDDITHDDVLEWNARTGGVVAVRRESLGAIVLHESPTKSIDAEAGADVLLDAIRRADGVSLKWSDAASRIRERMAFVHSIRDDWPDVGEHALSASLETWLRPHLVGLRRRTEVEQLPLGDILLGMLTWDQRRQLDELAPSHWTAPTESRVPIDYSDPAAPAVSIRLQEVFGVAHTPRLGSVALTFELLSPAHRPVQVTRDLAGFWRTSYFDVRKELRGRYPRYYWPEDPLVAEPTRRAKPR